MEDVELTKFGSSLPVACVKELVKEALADIPPRYIRPDQEPPNVTLPLEVPVIDLQKLLSSHAPELDRLHNACKDWGFFQLINHGVSELLVKKVKKLVQELFDLPMEEKKMYSQKPGDIEGYGQTFVKSEEQQLDWADMFFVTTLPEHLRKPHLFPNLPLPLRDTLEEYSAAQKTTAMTILYQIAKALRMDENDMRELFEERWQAFRMNYYPPCPQPELVMGFNSHSDAVGLTILLQITADDIQGLQIKKDGNWVSVTPLPNAFIVNVGDILEIISNGICKSVEHRATVNFDRERISLATFLSPKLDGELGPAPSLITPQCPPEFRRISVRDYFKGYFGKELIGKSYTDSMRIQKH